MDCRTPGFPVLYYLLEFSQIHVHWVIPANHLLLRRPLILLPSIFPSIRVFSNESALCIRCPKYWSFSFSPSNEYSVLSWIFIGREEKDGKWAEAGEQPEAGPQGNLQLLGSLFRLFMVPHNKTQTDAGHQKPSAPGVLFRCPARILGEFSFF